MLDIKTILIIASSGGGGLIQAANAKEQELRLKYPHARIIRKDLLKDWVGKWGGKFAISLWNYAQKSGSVRILKFLCIGNVIVDICFAPYAFFNMLTTLFKDNVDLIIDTQPLCTASMIKALRFFHWKTRKKVLLEKVLVDLPTPKATHYFRSIRHLSNADRPYLKITTILPFLQKGETSQAFWKKHCRLSEQQVSYEPFYVRQSFLHYHKKPRLLQPFRIKAAIRNQEELQLIQAAVNRGSIQAHWTDREVEFVIEPEDRVFTILLGSQPAYEGSLNYVRHFIQLAKEMTGRKSHLFIFCANHHNHINKRGFKRLIYPSRQPSLLQSVSHLVQKTADYPSSLSVIPLSFQNDQVIAPIFHRSDVTCTRSGGHTLMELMCIAPKHIWIHSETKKKQNLTQKELLEGIAGWEAANALYMQEIYGAKIVTPYSFIAHARSVMLESV